MRYKFLLLVGIILLVILSSPVLASGIGYVDYELLFNSHPEYSVKNEEFQQSVEELKIAFSIESQSVAEEYIDALIEFYEDKIDKLYEELRDSILDSIGKAIIQVAEENNISIVLTDTSVLYGGIDLTKIVLEKLYGFYGISVPSYLR